ncbi:hypothetical protein CYY_002221 [Polysphondylium violaceum]|uniref:tRNA-uridine aminocarboxypropyltransferase n=1 Tax=Polysphondylium violaceum TaxID=133409 RepID=A0A8J4Q860_9MYCE|nr:hypothetical protein CYY_002221 [Polysphondylium violaceum]
MDSESSNSNNNNSIKPNRKIFTENYKDHKAKKYESLIKNTTSPKCQRCWLLMENCICSKLKNIKLKHEYILCFHPNEWAKASNTGKLIPLCESTIDNSTEPIDQTPSFSNSIYMDYTKKSKILLIGNERDEAYFDSIVNADNASENTFVLFPSPDSINIKDLLKLKSIDIKENSNNNIAYNNKNNQDNNDDNNEDDDDCITTITESVKNININREQLDKLDTLRIIIVDGTWRQAKTMTKRIPKHIKRIHLEFGSLMFKSLFNILRSQPQVDRISTLEATILSMKTLGESDDTISNLIDGLKLLIDTIVLQSHKEQYVAIKEQQWVGRKKDRKNTRTQFINENNDSIQGVYDDDDNDNDE